MNSVKNEPTSKKGHALLIMTGLLLLTGGLFYAACGPDAATLPIWTRILLRAGGIGVALIAWFRSQALIGARPMNSTGIGDGVHELTASLNRYLHKNPRQANLLLIMSSFFIDAFGVFLICAAIFGSSMRPFIGLLILFGMRQVCQGVCALPSPPGMIWRYPGCPALLVTYGVANDYFFSGHTAIAVLGAIEMLRIGPLWLGIAAGAVALGEAIAVLVLRAHYTMDVFTAIVAAWVAADLAQYCTQLIGI